MTSILFFNSSDNSFYGFSGGHLLNYSLRGSIEELIPKSELVPFNSHGSNLQTKLSWYFGESVQPDTSFTFYTGDILPGSRKSEASTEKQNH